MLEKLKFVLLDRPAIGSHWVAPDPRFATRSKSRVGTQATMRMLDKAAEASPEDGGGGGEADSKPHTENRVLELEGWHWARGEHEQLAAPLHIRGLNFLLPLMPLYKKKEGYSSFFSSSETEEEKAE